MGREEACARCDPRGVRRYGRELRRIEPSRCRQPRGDDDVEPYDQPNSSGAAGTSGADKGGGDGAKIGVPFSVAGSVQQLTKFAACVRANGEPTFPDPNAQGVISASFNRASPQFSQALQACRKDLPGGIPSPAQQAQDPRQAVAFSDCMRRNGIPEYPDPQTGAGGGMVIHLANIDPSSPQFQRAQATCRKKFPAAKRANDPPINRDL
jgi:hypothetical protein